jgi:hypothetical protein
MERTIISPPDYSVTTIKPQKFMVVILSLPLLITVIKAKLYAIKLRTRNLEKYYLLFINITQIFIFLQKFVGLESILNVHPTNK